MDFKIKTLHLDDKVSREGVQNSAIVFTHKRGLGWWIWRKKGIPQSRHIILIWQLLGVGYHDILCLRAIMGILLVAFSSGDLSYLKRWRSVQFLFPGSKVADLGHCRPGTVQNHHSKVCKMYIVTLLFLPRGHHDVNIRYFLVLSSAMFYLLIHCSYYRGAQGIIVVYDVTNQVSVQYHHSSA